MKQEKFKRSIFQVVAKRIQEKRRFIQALAGPRQVGKTTLVHQILQRIRVPFHYASADEPALQSRTWISQQWEIARIHAKSSDGAILVLDEIQKLDAWSSYVKQLWDEDTHFGTNLQVVILGSSFLLLQLGLSESLAGRFELIHVPHWSFSEVQRAFGLNLEESIYFGTYPGASSLIHEPERWKRYVLDSLIETTLSRDVLLMSHVHKPALLRRLFELGCLYSSQILSYQKMIGQLQDAGNTTTLAHYLELLSAAGLLTSIQKYAGETVRQRASSPKFQVLNNALFSAQSRYSFDEARRDREHWGRLVESAVGAHFLNSMAGSDAKIYYWREKNREVDFILETNRQLFAIEVKSGRSPESLPGVENFIQCFPRAKPILIGGAGISLESFFQTNALDHFKT